MSLVVSHTEPVISEIHMDADGIVGDWISFEPQTNGVTIAMRGSVNGSTGHDRRVTYVHIHTANFVELVNALQQLADQVSRG